MTRNIVFGTAAASALVATLVTAACSGGNSAPSTPASNEASTW